LGYSQPSPDETSTRSELEQIFEEAEKINSLRSLIIQQDGEMISQRFFKGRSPNQAFNIKSASKSIIGLLTGIAVAEGFIPTVDEPISTYFHEDFVENPDPEKESITVRNLLSVQTWLRSRSSGTYGAWVLSNNWVEYALEQDFVTNIDGRMVYSTGTSHLLSVIITKASGMSTKAFAERYLFSPMGIEVGGWDRDPQGYYMGGNNMALKPADLLKIGQMLIDDGVWEGERIISKEWIKDSFKTYTYSNYNPYGYGYQRRNKDTAAHPTVFAWGIRGQ